MAVIAVSSWLKYVLGLAALTKFRRSFQSCGARMESFLDLNRHLETADGSYSCSAEGGNRIQLDLPKFSGIFHFQELLRMNLNKKLVGSWNRGHFLKRSSIKMKSKGLFDGNQTL